MATKKFAALLSTAQAHRQPRQLTAVLPSDPVATDHLETPIQKRDKTWSKCLSETLQHKHFIIWLQNYWALPVQLQTSLEGNGDRSPFSYLPDKSKPAPCISPSCRSIETICFFSNTLLLRWVTWKCSQRLHVHCLPTPPPPERSSKESGQQCVSLSEILTVQQILTRLSSEIVLTPWFVLALPFLLLLQ